MRAPAFFLLCSAQVAAPSADESTIREIVRSFAETRNAVAPAKGAKIASLYSESGQRISAGGNSAIQGRSALAALWGRLTGRVDRTVESASFPAPNIALVR